MQLIYFSQNEVEEAIKLKKNNFATNKKKPYKSTDRRQDLFHFEFLSTYYFPNSII